MLVAMRSVPRKPLKRFPKINRFPDPKLKLGENERLQFQTGSFAVGVDLAQA